MYKYKGKSKDQCYHRGIDAYFILRYDQIFKSLHSSSSVTVNFSMTVDIHIDVCAYIHIYICF